MKHRRTQRRRVQARALPASLAVVIVAGGLLVPASAGAARVSTNTSQGLYTFLPAAGEANTLTIDGDATNYTFTDSVAITDQDSGGACTQLQFELTTLPSRPSGRQ